MHTPECFADHMGIWAIDPTYMRQAVSSIKSGAWQPSARERSTVSSEPDLYATHEGVAVINVHGPMMKGRSKYGGTSTVDARRALRAAVGDRRVHSVLLHVDSPGGHVAGTAELADEVKSARASGKPVMAHIDDMGASAAYWVASQAERITINATGSAGSIGVLAVVEDTSAMFEKMGVEVHVVSTGPAKGDLVDGKPVTKEIVARIQDRIDSLFAHFATAVKSGRGRGGQQMSDEAFKAVSDGRVFGSDEALALGLVDGVQSFEQTLNELITSHRSRQASSRARALGLQG